MPALAGPLLADAQAAGVELRFALLPNVYGGPAATAGPVSLVDELIAAAAGRPGPGVTDVGPDAVVPLCYAHDCAVGLYLLMRSNHRQPLMLAHQARHSLSEVAAELSRLSLRPVVTAGSGPVAAFQPPEGPRADLRRVLAWSPPTDLHAGLAIALNGAGGAR
jgi:nucleoside-diphosphate-sugar epimerase